ncbi:unnamed protein product [Ambrosiozyma monospora]|uniref:Unnamed protein product n=1 Tax=Ambrosiozyma monospora TaxID=43982 RepID=A0A9W6Z7P6_AMBMO|nr:unnamed protein product [Ambrosiozyma monospora]
MFGLGTLFYSILFLINGIAVLSEDRFLNRIGWSAQAFQSQSQQQQFNGGYDTPFGSSAMNISGSGSGSNAGDSSIKAKLINLISATRTLLRFPLIIANVIVILYELVLG